ncbi:MAG: hypothetical protein AAGA18_08795 [Verrucomicrobiota bacterium]
MTSIKSNPSVALKRSSTNALYIIIPVWIVLGFFWTVVQFLVCEATYQIANSMDESVSDTLYEISDYVAWPAGIIYDFALAREYKNALESFVESHEPSDGDKEMIGSILDEYQRDYAHLDFQDEVDEVLAKYDEYVEVHGVLEYIIYIGTCIAWGIIITIVGIRLSFYVVNSVTKNKTNSPPPLPNK